MNDINSKKRQIKSLRKERPFNYMRDYFTAEIIMIVLKDGQEGKVHECGFHKGRLHVYIAKRDGTAMDVMVDCYGWDGLLSVA